MEQESKEDVGSGSQACPICNSPATDRCSKCASAYYCSKEHQKEHWPEHKAKCKEIHQKKTNEQLAEKKLTTAEKNAKIPKEHDTKFTVDAILFPVDEETPRIIQMGFVQKRAEILDSPGDYEDIHFFDPDYTKKYLERGFVGRNYIFHQSTGGKRIPEGCTLDVVYSEDFLYGGFKVNRCIHKLTNGRSVIDWRGNVIALRRPKGRKSGLPGETVVNIEEEDMRYLLNYFMGH
ncbi:hypothetical protein SCHPADRAFT_1001474 [Schizopora paradoxa]|uniref:MYND-type domain-containing protein n=1 Tax=Schizopora paradoxa TaxID=27342 RepID=A0A0H2RDR2_9AGAM|nr:hypothetical protein SCHPADRAFT_1001474 [Schizopora paradoxa]